MTEMRKEINNYNQAKALIRDNNFSYAELLSLKLLIWDKIDKYKEDLDNLMKH